MQLRPFFVLAALALGCRSAQTPAAATASTSSNAPVAFGDLDAAIAGPHRSEADRARDAHRHPRETLTFFGIAPGQTVVELSPSGGWYTAILAPLLHDRGTLVAAIPDPAGPRARYAQRFLDFQAARPDLYGNVRRVVLEPPGQVNLGAPGSADAVLTFRNVHGWVNDNAFDAVLTSAFAVLRPGGVLGVVEHRAAEAADPATSARQGYVPEAFVIARAQAAGFVLDARSEINANPRDTRDYENGVWALPPTLRGGNVDRARFVAIGESDRMTLRFRKPATP